MLCVNGPLGGLVAEEMECGGCAVDYLANDRYYSVTAL